MLSLSISRQNQIQIQEIVMITIAVIAAVIGTTELLFELADNNDRKRHDRNHCQSSLNRSIA